MYIHIYISCNIYIYTRLHYLHAVHALSLSLYIYVYVNCMYMYHTYCTFVNTLIALNTTYTHIYMLHILKCSVYHSIVCIIHYCLLSFYIVFVILSYVVLYCFILYHTVVWHSIFCCVVCYNILCCIVC